MTADEPVLSVCISTKNRSDDLELALSSLSLLAGLPFEVLVTDDGSTTPVAPVVEKARRALGVAVHLQRNEQSTGYIVARNAMARAARGKYVLSLDDDARLKDAASILEPIALLEADPSVAVVALAQERADVPELHSYQPAPVDYRCQVRMFFGYGHVLRRELFVSLGGYREIFHFYHEEPELCKRMIEAGYRIIYDPRWRVIHAASPIGRSNARIVGAVAKNRVLELALVYPPLVAAGMLPRIFATFLAQRRALPREERKSEMASVTRLVRDVAKKIGPALEQRTPVSMRTLREWRSLGQEWPRYELPRS